MNASLCESLRQSYEFSCGLLAMLEGTDEMIVQIHATLDDVGNCRKDGMNAVVGYVGYKSEWNKFNWRWMMTLQELKGRAIPAHREIPQQVLPLRWADDGR